MTYEQVEARKDRGVEGLRNMGQDERADELEEEDVEDFAERKQITIVNPGPQPRAAVRYRGKSRNPGYMEEQQAALDRAAREAGKGVSAKLFRNGTVQVKADGQNHFFDDVHDALGFLEGLAAMRRQGNPDNVEDAAAMFQRFHGRKPTSVQEIKLRQANRRNLSGLGKLVMLRSATSEEYFGGGKGFCWDEDDGVICCSDPDGNQIYFIGGDQNVEPLLADAGFDTSKDLLDLGPCDIIEYVTDKHFDGFEEKIYQHQFGEETGEAPRLLFCNLTKSLYLAGGAYEVKPEGIVN